MTYRNEHLETVCSMSCEGASLAGILHDVDTKQPTHGVVIVVGGPQYRVGSHRQFLLLARHLADAGVPTLRFDYRGMGDSEGEARDFEGIQADIVVAIESMKHRYPLVRHWTLWGLCDAATASAFYAAQEPGVDGLVLLNPWVRTESGQSRAYIKHYYLKRFFSPAFWKKLLSGRFSWSKSMQDLGGNVQRAYATTDAGGISVIAPLPERLLVALSRFNGQILFILSGNDLTAKEFEQAVEQSAEWQALMQSNKVQTHRLDEADHTFSRRVWRDEVAATTTIWVKSQ